MRRVLEIGAGSGYNVRRCWPPWWATRSWSPRWTSMLSSSSRPCPSRPPRPRGNYGRRGRRRRRGARWSLRPIVATVGCADISPSWYEQLDEHGELLVPLVHGSAHPLGPAHEERRSTRRGLLRLLRLVSIQGVQADQSPWATVRRRPLTEPSAIFRIISSPRLPYGHGSTRVEPHGVGARLLRRFPRPASRVDGGTSGGRLVRPSRTCDAACRSGAHGDHLAEIWLR